MPRDENAGSGPPTSHHQSKLIFLEETKMTEIVLLLMLLFGGLVGNSSTGSNPHDVRPADVQQGSDTGV